MYIQKSGIISTALLFLLFSVFPFTGCGGAGGGSADSSLGTLKISVTDAPVDDADKVVVRFTGVEVHAASGESLDFDYASPREIDLLALNGSASELILDEVIDPGHYNWIRLKVEAEQGVVDSYVEISGLVYPIWIPSGSQAGLKLNSGFEVAAGVVADFTIDFDLRQSLHNPAGVGDDYMLMPMLRMVDNADVGQIDGMVDAALMEDSSCTGGGVVYLYSGSILMPDDIDGTSPDPIASTKVEYYANEEEFRFFMAFIEAGDYTISFTCQASGDDPEKDDDIVFLTSFKINVGAGETVIHNCSPDHSMGMGM